MAVKKSCARTAATRPARCTTLSTPRKISNASPTDDLVVFVVGGAGGYVERDGHLVDPERDLERRKSFG